MINKRRTVKRVERRGSDGKEYFAERQEALDGDQTVTLIERYVIDGTEYDRIGDVPSREREELERMLAGERDDGFPKSFGSRFTGGTIRVSASARAKPLQIALIVYVVVALTCLGLCLMTVHDRFLPSVAYTRRVETVDTVIALLLSAPLLVIVFGLMTGWRERIVAPVVAVLFFFAVQVAISEGLPSVLHRFSGVSAELVVTVTKPGAGYARRCGYNADVHHPTIVNDTICDLGDWVWRPLMAGDQLKLSGSLSEFGFAYDPDLAERIPARALEK